MTEGAHRSQIAGLTLGAMAEGEPGEHDAALVHLDAVAESSSELRWLRAYLQNYADQIEPVTGSDHGLLAATDVLRRLMEAVYQQPITFDGEERPNGNDDVEWQDRLELARTDARALMVGDRADSETELDRLLQALPLREWMNVTVTPLGPHPSDPATAPRLSRVYRLDATLGEPLDVGETAGGRRRIVPLTGGTFSGPELNGTLVAGASADWQTVLPDGTALGDIRYTLRTDGGDLLYVRSHAIRHAAARELDWLNKGVFIAVAARAPASVIYDTYLVE